MDNEELLTAAKQRFYRCLLEDDVLAQLVLDSLTDTRVEVANLPDFTAEPWRPNANEGEAQQLGLRLTMSSLARSEEIMIGFGVFKHLVVLVTTKVRGEHTLLTADRPDFHFDGTDAFMALDIDLGAKKTAALCFMRLWQEFCQTAIALGAVIDGMTGTFTTEIRSYSTGE